MHDPLKQTLNIGHRKFPNSQPEVVPFQVKQISWSGFVFDKSAI